MTTPRFQFTSEDCFGLRSGRRWRLRPYGRLLSFQLGDHYRYIVPLLFAPILIEAVRMDLNCSSLHWRPPVEAFFVLR